MNNILPMATLTNGLRVANFSSGHTFEFEDGVILPACSSERVDQHALIKGMHVKTVRKTRTGREWQTVKVYFVPSEATVEELLKLDNDDSIDVVIVPRVLLDALDRLPSTVGRKARTILCVRRAQDGKNQVNSIRKFCAY